LRGKTAIFQGVLRFPLGFNVVFGWLFVVILWSQRGSYVHRFLASKNSHFLRNILGADLRLEFDDDGQRPIRAMGRDGRQ
jgi:hypothetical protein